MLALMVCGQKVILAGGIVHRFQALLQIVTIAITIL